LKQDIADLNSQFNEQKATIDKLKLEITEYQQKNESLIKSNSHMNEIINQQELRIKSLEKEVSEYKRKIENLNHLIPDIKFKADSKITELTDKIIKLHNLNLQNIQDAYPIKKEFDFLQRDITEKIERIKNSLKEEIERKDKSFDKAFTLLKSLFIEDNNQKELQLLENKQFFKEMNRLIELEDNFDRNLCVICCDKKRETLFLPCRHQVVCREHAQTVERCPICRSEIESKIDILLA